MGIEREVLDYFASKCSPGECIVEMLDYWLQNHEQLTWREVVRALKAINLQQLALDIDSVYKIGNGYQLKKGLPVALLIIVHGQCM